MPQHSDHFSIAATSRLATADGMLRLGSTLIIALVLVLLITHGGAG